MITMRSIKMKEEVEKAVEEYHGRLDILRKNFTQADLDSGKFQLAKLDILEYAMRRIENALANF